MLTETFADMYRLAVKDKHKEAIALGVTLRQVYNYGDVAQPHNQLKASQVPLSTARDPILAWLRTVGGLKYIPNGDVDGKIGKIISYLGHLRENWATGNRADWRSIAELRDNVEKLVQELAQ